MDLMSIDLDGAEVLDSWDTGEGDGSYTVRDYRLPNRSRIMVDSEGNRWIPADDMTCRDYIGDFLRDNAEGREALALALYRAGIEYPMPPIDGGACCVLVERSYYDRHRWHWMTDGDPEYDTEARVFPTVAEAQKAIKDAEEEETRDRGCYHLAYNEYARPVRHVVPVP